MIFITAFFDTNSEKKTKRAKENWSPEWIKNLKKKQINNKNESYLDEWIKLSSNNANKNIIAIPSKNPILTTTKRLKSTCPSANKVGN